MQESILYNHINDWFHWIWKTDTNGKKHRSLDYINVFINKLYHQFALDASKLFQDISWRLDLSNNFITNSRFKGKKWYLWKVDY